MAKASKKPKAKRANLVLTEKYEQLLEELAEENAGQNKSLMVRKLIEKAYENPEALGLYPPKDVALVHLN